NTLHFWPGLPASCTVNDCIELWAGWAAGPGAVIGCCARARAAQANVVTRAFFHIDRTIGRVSFPLPGTARKPQGVALFLCYRLEEMDASVRICRVFARGGARRREWTNRES